MVENFTYHAPTALHFGAGVLEELPETLGAYGTKVLLVYGGGSIRKTGLYDRLQALLEGFAVVELGGVEPNPKYTQSVLPGVRLCKEHGVEVILAVGGGSVVDCAKAIAAGACYDGDLWELISGEVEPTAALPLIDIITAAATGSEYNCDSVISRSETNDKLSFYSSLHFPKASFLDPTITYTVSKRQTAAGIADAINHVMESYFCEVSSIRTDGFCEALIRSLMVHGPVALAKPENYEARAAVMADCALACNDIICMGNSPSGWPMHAIEHALSGHFGVVHGEGLAVITPHWMRKILNPASIHRFVSFGTHLFDIDPALPEETIANQTIGALTDFFASIGEPTTLRELGVDKDRLPEVAHHIATHEALADAWIPLDEQDVLDILQASY